jgi:hypothetical protein
MDKIDNDVQTIVQEAVRSYATAGFKSKLYFVINEDETVYSVIFVPDEDYPVKMDTEVVVSARFKNNYVLVERDDTDRPLYQELMRRGIPREQIILRYAGERLPEAK